MTNTQTLSHVIASDRAFAKNGGTQNPSWNFELFFMIFAKERRKKKIFFGLFEKLTRTIKLMHAAALRQTIKFFWPYAFDIICMLPHHATTKH